MAFIEEGGEGERAFWRVRRPRRGPVVQKLRVPSEGGIERDQGAGEEGEREGYIVRLTTPPIRRPAALAVLFLRGIVTDEPSTIGVIGRAEGAARSEPEQRRGGAGK